MNGYYSSSAITAEPVTSWPMILSDSVVATKLADSAGVVFGPRPFFYNPAFASISSIVRGCPAIPAAIAGVLPIVR